MADRRPLPLPSIGPRDAERLAVCVACELASNRVESDDSHGDTFMHHSATRVAKGYIAVCLLVVALVLLCVGIGRGATQTQSREPPRAKLLEPCTSDDEQEPDPYPPDEFLSGEDGEWVRQFRRCVTARRLRRTLP